MNKIIRRDWDEKKLKELTEFMVHSAEKEYLSLSGGLFHLFYEVETFEVETYELEGNIWKLYEPASDVFYEEGLRPKTNELVEVLSVPGVITERGYKVIGNKVGRIWGLSEDAFVSFDGLRRVAEEKARRLGNQAYHFLRREVLKALKSDESIDRDEDGTKVWVWVWKPGVAWDYKTLTDYLMGIETLYNAVIRLKMSMYFGWKKFPPKDTKIQERRAR